MKLLYITIAIVSLFTVGCATSTYELVPVDEEVGGVGVVYKTPF